MIKEKIEKIKREITEVCKKIGRPVEQITMLAVSKTVGSEIVEEAVAAGHFCFAENKVQELAVKRGYFENKKCNNLSWHLIGHLQSNKIKSAVDNADLFHCLDSVKLAQKINQYCLQQNRIFNMLVQINSSGEESKSGITPNDLPAFLAELSPLQNIRICGLMSIGRYNSLPEESRPEFKLMKRLFDYGAGLKQPNCEFKYLSMGMSHDFGVAIEEGANIVRVGTAIFGERNYNKE